MWSYKTFQKRLERNFFIALPVRSGSEYDTLQAQDTNARSLTWRHIVYNELDWSSLPLPELLEKALEFGNKAYSGSLSTFVFLDRALEKTPKHTDLSNEVLNMADMAEQAYQLLAELNRDMTNLAQELPKPVK